MKVPSAEQQTGAEDYRTYAVKMANKYGLDASVFTSLIQQESGFQQYKNGAINTGSAGELGLGQLKPTTAAEVGVNPLDPYENIEGAARYLRKQLDATGGEYYGALAAYNQGLAGSRGKGRQNGMRYAEQVMQRAADAESGSYEKNWFEKTFSEGGTLRGSFFSDLAQNGGILVAGVGILFIALYMTGKKEVTQLIKGALS